MTPISLSAEERRGKYVPWIIAAFFVSFMLPLISFVVIAFNHKPTEVTENAYQKGLAYNRTLEKASAQSMLGWQAEIKLEGNTVQFTLKDKSGNPLAAQVSGWLVRPSEGALDRRLALKQTVKGLYEGKVEWPAKGLWEVHVTALSGGQEFQAEKTITIR